jgi:hypothetical protein
MELLLPMSRPSEANVTKATHPLVVLMASALAIPSANAQEQAASLSNKSAGMQSAGTNSAQLSGTNVMRRGVGPAFVGGPAKNTLPINGSHFGTNGAASRH